jgi:hypothetical protein
MHLFLSWQASAQALQKQRFVDLFANTCPRSMFSRAGRMDLNRVFSSAGRAPLRIIGWGTAGAVLLLPMVAMVFTDAVDWDWFDFSAMAPLLGCTGLAVEFLAGRACSTSYRAGAGLGMLAAFLLIWINLAVGIIGSEANPANRVFLLAPALLAVAAIVVRFRPAGMAFVMVHSAFALVLVPLAAWIFMRHVPLRDLVEALGVTGLLATLWLMSAMLFRRAVRDEVR